MNAIHLQKVNLRVSPLNNFDNATPLFKNNTLEFSLKHHNGSVTLDFDRILERMKVDHD